MKKTNEIQILKEQIYVKDRLIKNLKKENERLKKRIINDFELIINKPIKPKGGKE